MEQFTRIEEVLVGIVGRENVTAFPEHTARYAVDGITPKAVVVPADIEQVAEVVKLANRERMAVIAWGSGSKIGMGSPPDRLDLVISTSRLNHMTDVDTANLTITVQAGVKIKDIQTRLASEDNRCYLPLADTENEAGGQICSERENTGCFLPFDPPFGDSATIGGVVAGNSSGPRQLLYGLPRDLVLGVRFVAPNGDIIGTGGKTVKNVSGYDISKLMIGSWGTLGILSEMTLRLLPLPEKMETLLFAYPTLSDAAAFADSLFETSLLPAAVEVINRTLFKRLEITCTSDTETCDYWAAIALEGFDEAVSRMRNDMGEIAKNSGAKGKIHLRGDRHQTFWQAISNLEIPLVARFSDIIRLKLNYPLSQWKDIISFATGVLSSKNIGHTLMAHAGSGICIINLLLDEEPTAAMDKGIHAIDALSSRCREVAGNLVVQRAPVELKQHLSVWGYTGPNWAVMKRIRDQLDPQGVMSPGRFIGGP